jgi:hypothetical protein
MKLLEILQIVIAVATIATGAVSLFRPESIRGFTGLVADGPRGITEIRAIMGGVFIGLGVAPLILRAPEAYRTLGITYLVIAVIRAVSMVIDRSLVSSNTVSLLVEILFGIILML